MKIQSVIRKGSEHPVFCEDFLVTQQSGRFFLGVVFDGCSGGDESHFASSLMGKLFRQVVNSGHLQGESMEELAKNFMKTYVDSFFKAKVAVGLYDGELLATFIMIMYDTVKGEALTMTIGDGIICCDGEITILENDRFKESHPGMYTNMPDYIAYDLDKLGTNPDFFDEWFDKRITLNTFIDPQDISISTDGLLTFNTPVEPVNILEYLLIDDTWMNNKIMLSKKVNVLSKKHKTIHKDDISIIRIVPNFKEDDRSDS
jgi:hypothetical protein